MDLALLKSLNVARAERRAVVLVTKLADGEDRLFDEGETVEGELGQRVSDAFRNGQSRLVAIDGADYFLNVHLPPPRIVAIGAVHITQALAPMAAIAGYDLEIIDPRTAFATEERFGGTRLYAEWPEDVLKRSPLDSYTAVAAVTHDPKIDDFALKAALEAGCFYVGALGSRKTHAKRVERLGTMGVAPGLIEKISAPIGLDIGASTPAEIAVAVLGDIIRAFRSRALSRDAGA